jgi:hypothetical protein
LLLLLLRSLWVLISKQGENRREGERERKTVGLYSGCGLVFQGGRKGKGETLLI